MLEDLNRYYYLCIQKKSGTNKYELVHRQSSDPCRVKAELDSSLKPYCVASFIHVHKGELSKGRILSRCLSPTQFSCSVVSDSSWPHGPQHARPPCPSPTPRACWNSCPLSQWCHPTISSSVVPFSSRLKSFPASGSVHMSQLFASGGQSIGVSASKSVLPMNIQDWFPLGWTGWISVQSKGLLRVSSNTTVQKHQFFGAQFSLSPSDIYRRRYDLGHQNLSTRGSEWMAQDLCFMGSVFDEVTTENALFQGKRRIAIKERQFPGNTMKRPVQEVFICANIWPLSWQDVSEKWTHWNASQFPRGKKERT